MKKLYAVLAILGFLVPISQLVPYVQKWGLTLGPLFSQPFVNPAASLFALDLLASCAIFLTFALVEDRRRMPLYVAATLLVGLCFALPLFLFFRERSREARGFAAVAA